MLVINDVLFCCYFLPSPSFIHQSLSLMTAQSCSLVYLFFHFSYYLLMVKKCFYPLKIRSKKIFATKTPTGCLYQNLKLSVFTDLSRFTLYSVRQPLYSYLIAIRHPRIWMFWVTRLNKLEHKALYFFTPKTYKNPKLKLKKHLIS